MSVLTLTLLHPNKPLPIQNWTFESETTIRIGRALDNNVVLFSAVVSRHHLELREKGNGWEVVNLGANGTFEVALGENGLFVDSRPIQQIMAVDGMIVRLASSGPKIQIHIRPKGSLLMSKLKQHSESLAASLIEPVPLGESATEGNF
jgi:pSer/pThr/pTyr-binding forkhead associated (FHA) protein